MTISMLALAGFPATAGFFGKIYLHVPVSNGYSWLGVVIVLGSAVSLAYYLRVIAAVWMRSPAEIPARAPHAAAARPAMAGGSPRRRGGPPRRSPVVIGAGVALRLVQWEVVFAPLARAAATVFFALI